ncbi:hypothetical protein BGX26_001071, partial [Mortierella sp. AD094]
MSMTNSIRFPDNKGSIVQKGQGYTQEDIHRNQGRFKEASNRHEVAIEDCPVDDQKRLKGPPSSELPLKRKASYNNFPVGCEAPSKSAKQFSEMPIRPSQELILARPYSPKLIPDYQATADSAPALLSFSHVQVALQTYYEPYLTIQRVSGDTLSLESCYINLAIVEAPDQRRKEKEELKVQAAAFHRLPSFEGISKANMKGSIPLETLFDERELRDGRNGVPRAILVQGRAGIGKTTLCKKLVHAYQSGLWRDRFDVVLWLPLRQLKAFRAHNLEDLLCKKYFEHRPKNEKDALVSALTARVRDGKVLFVLDGLDEVLTDTRLEEGIVLDSLLRNLIGQDHVVITSRPSGVDMSILPKLDLELETIGFSTQNVNDYLTNVLTPDDATAVQGFIKRTPLIQSLVNIPVQLDVICYNWDPLLWNESVTVAGLYQTMVRKLWCKDVLRLQKSKPGNELTPPLIKILRPYQIEQLMAVESEYLGCLAFKGIQHNHQIEFDEQTLCDAMEELDQYRAKANQEPLPLQLLNTLKQTLFLHTADADLDAGKNDSHRAWYFLHLTFQEYFAATWLSRHLKIDQGSSTRGLVLSMTLEMTKTFIQRHKYNPRYEVVWWMVAGQLEDKALELFFDLLKGAPRDLIGGRHQQLLAGFLKEAQPRLNEEAIRGLEAELMQRLNFEMTLCGGSDSAIFLGRQSIFPEELLIKSLSGTKSTQLYALKVLRDRSHFTSSTIKYLTRCMYDANRYIKIAAAEALGNQYTLPESIIQALVESILQVLGGALHDKDLHIRSSAAEALGNQSTLPESILQVLVGALHDEDLHVRSSAAKALGNQSTLPESTIQALVGALCDEDFHVWSSAAKALTNQSTLPESTIQ